MNEHSNAVAEVMGFLDDAEKQAGRAEWVLGEAESAAGWMNALGELAEASRALVLAQEVTARRGRACGATWTQIGAQLGITKQAAQQRFGGAQ